LYLDHYGIMCSSGSACTIESQGPSHVLISCSVGGENEYNSIRFTLGKQNTKADIDYVLKYLIPVVKELRRVKQIN